MENLKQCDHVFIYIGENTRQCLDCFIVDSSPDKKTWIRHPKKFTGLITDKKPDVTIFTPEDI